MVVIIIPQKGKPISYQFVGGLLLMICNGFHLGWGLVVSNVLGAPWTIGYSTEAIYLVMIFYFIAAFLGFFVVAYVYRLTSTRNIYFTAWSSSILSSILFLALPKEYFAVLFARILAGFAQGLCYLTIIVHGSEVVTPKIRGACISSIHFCVVFGIFFMSVIKIGVSDIRDEFADLNFLMGLFTLLFSLMSVPFLFFVKNSPVWHLQRKQERDALKVLLYLNELPQETNRIRSEFNELQEMVQEDGATNHKLFGGDNLRPLLLVLLMKVGYVLSFNFLLNSVRYSFTDMFVHPKSSQNFVLLVAFGIRIGTSIVALCSIDALGRRKLFLVSSGGAGLTLFLLGIFTEAYWNSTANGILLIIFEIFCGLGIGFTADVYSGEAFDSFRKPKSIAFLSIIEYFLQICIIMIYVPITRTTLSVMSFVSSILMLAITIYLYFVLPETTKKSIRQTKNEFLRRSSLFWN